MRTEHFVVLVADDSVSARESMGQLLARDPYILHMVDSGDAAVQALSLHPVDLLLCEVVMPRMGGFELARIMKGHPEWRFIPIIMTSALDGQDDMVRGIEAGADDFLAKPVDRVLLRARMRALLRVRDHYTALRNAIVPDVEALVMERRERIIGPANLTTREREVLDLLLLGRGHTEIARTLGIASRTSKFHQASILEKLGAESRADLIRLFT